MITNQCMGCFVLITATLPAGPCLSARIQNERQGEQERQEKGGLSNREVHGSCVCKNDIMTMFLSLCIDTHARQMNTGVVIHDDDDWNICMH